MRIVERIEEQVASTRLPLVAITLAAVPCPDTPVILVLHWHGFIKQKLAEVEDAETVSYLPIPSSALQLNDRWRSLIAVDRAAMEAGWKLGAWDVARAERPGCARPGAPSTETLECLRAFGTFPCGGDGSQVVVSEAPDAEDLAQLAARRGYLMWAFRPVKGGIWAEYADDATLGPEGSRDAPCPHSPIPPVCAGKRQTVYRFGVAGSSTYN